MPGVVPYGPKTIRKYKRSRVAMHRVGMEDGWRDRAILRRLPISNIIKAGFFDSLTGGAP